MPPRRAEEGREGREVAAHEGAEVGPNGAFFYRAPLPPAAEFARYEQVVPGSADRILKMAENQSGHRRMLEKIVVITDSVKAMVGIIGAIGIVATGMIGGIYLIMNDKSTEGFVAILLPLATVSGAFIFKNVYGKREDPE